MVTFRLSPVLRPGFAPGFTRFYALGTSLPAGPSGAAVSLFPMVCAGSWEVSTRHRAVRMPPQQMRSDSGVVRYLRASLFISAVSVSSARFW